MAKTVVELNPDRCVCCHACVVACQDLHYDVDEPGPALRRALRREDSEGRIFCAAFGCAHCADAPCMAACRKNAIVRDEETGLVTVVRERCVGCGLCKKACPLSVPQIVDKKMVKCDGCIERLKQGLMPVCVKTCPSGALFLREPDGNLRSGDLRRRYLGEDG